MKETSWKFIFLQGKVTAVVAQTLCYYLFNRSCEIKGFDSFSYHSKASEVIDQC